MYVECLLAQKALTMFLRQLRTRYLGITEICLNISIMKNNDQPIKLGLNETWNADARLSAALGTHNFLSN